MRRARLSNLWWFKRLRGKQTHQRQSLPNGVNQQKIFAAVREILVQQRLQGALESLEWPEGLPFDDMLSQVRNTLESIGPKHRLLRTKEALDALIRQGYLTLSGNLLSLPVNQ